MNNRYLEKIAGLSKAVGAIGNFAKNVTGENLRSAKKMQTFDKSVGHTYSDINDEVLIKHMNKAKNLRRVADIADGKKSGLSSAVDMAKDSFGKGNVASAQASTNKARLLTGAAATGVAGGAYAMQKKAALPNAKGVMGAVEKIVSTTAQGLRVGGATARKASSTLGTAAGKQSTGPVRRAQRLDLAAHLAQNKANFAGAKAGNSEVQNKYLNKARKHLAAGGAHAPNVQSALAARAAAKTQVAKGAAGVAGATAVAHYAKKGWDSDSAQYQRY